MSTSDSLMDYPWSRVENTKNHARMSCFSATGDNLLMCAHYADGLRGFCIEFDALELLRGTPKDAQRVQVRYRTSPARFDRCLYEVAYDRMEWHETEGP